MSKKRLLIAGGGTGGHIAPALAVGSQAEQYFQVSYACTPRPVDTIMYSRVQNQVHVLNPPRIDRGMKILFPLTAVRSLCQAVRLLKKNRIDAVLGTGGYSSFFAVVAAGITGIPAALFESNAIPGKSNRIASRFCKVAFTGLPGGEKGLKARVLQRTGTPVSSGLQKHSAVQARQNLGIPESKPVVLFLGGSQGAAAINNMALEMSSDLTVLLQAGEKDYNRVSELAVYRENIKVRPFIEDLSLWYSAAELAVARAGGQTIAELSSFHLPAVLVPFPFAAEDHQTANAAVVEKAGAGLMIKQEGTSPLELSGLLLRLVSQQEELDRMKKAMGTLFPVDPPGRIVSRLQEMVL